MLKLSPVLLAAALAPTLLPGCVDDAAPTSSDPRYLRTAHGVLPIAATSLDDEWVMVLGDIKMRVDDLERYAIAPEDLAQAIASPPGDRAALRAVGARSWPGGVVPFTIAADLSDEEQGWVEGAIAHWHEVTSFRFVPRTNQVDYVRFIVGDACSSQDIGRMGGPQNVEVAGCDPAAGSSAWGRVAHELGHVVGFFHEQSRSDRDTYVVINTANIEPANDDRNCPHQYQTFIQQGRDGRDLGPYDYASIMHYGAAGGCSTGGDIIVPRQAGVTIGQRNALSLLDRYAAEQLFQGNNLTGPGGPVVTLYRDAAYGGVSQRFLPGFYVRSPTADLLAQIGEDQATSLRVPPGLAARLCVDNAQPDLGACQTFIADTAQLPATYDNRVSVVDIDRAVTVYRDANLTGTRQTLPRGEHRANAGQLAIVGNDQISSLLVPPGMVAELCYSESGAQSTGSYCRTFEGTVNAVGSFMDNQASLVRVRPAVTLYQESKLWGTRASLPFGTYTSSAWSPVAGISSLSVGEGAQAILCDGASGGGPCATFRGDVQFIGPDLNDKVSYVRVEAFP